MAKSRVSHEYTDAEDKSIRLGVVLIASGVLSFFIVLFCWLNPILQSMQTTPANCTVVSVKRPGEMFECVFTCGLDCRGTSLYPCLQVYVNNSQSDSLALLHYDEQQLLGNPKCSYVPPCERDDQKNSERVLLWQDYWTKEVRSRVFTCFFNQQRSRYQAQCYRAVRLAALSCVLLCLWSAKPNDVVWRQAQNESVVMHCVLWPLLCLLMGALIVLLTVCTHFLAERAEAIQKLS